MDMLAAGPAVQALSRSFDRYWNSALAYPIASLVPEPAPASAASATSSPQLDTPPPVEPTFGLPADAVAREIAPGGRFRLQWAVSRLLADDPAKIETMGNASPDQTMFDDVVSLLKSAQREVTIISPYLVPGQRGMKLMHELRARGVHVRILTSSLAATDAPVVHIGYAHYRVPMLKDGIELYELRPEVGAPARLGTFGASRARLHAKALVVDGRYLVVGSMNLDPRSMDLNSEIGMLINSPPLSQDVRKLFDEVVATSSYKVELGPHELLRWTEQTREGKGKVLDEEPESSFWRRLEFHLLEPFAPEEML
jgi:phosphatidylserine/phosphatidylglycerophosphate/cardiolipin synthase-like enzyme